MNEHQHSSIRPEANATSPAAAAARSVLPLALFYAAIVSAAWILQGKDGLLASGVAAVACLLSSGTATWLSAQLAFAGHPIGAAQVATLFRMALPLGLCCVLAIARGPVFEAGAVWYLIGCYGLALASDTRHAVERVVSPAVVREGR